MWTIVTDSAALDSALKLARGTYQEALLLGRESLSGSTLKGKASRYAGRYRASRDNLLARMSAAGVPWTEIRGDHNKRILVIGRAATAAAALGASPAAVREVASLAAEAS